MTNQEYKNELNELIKNKCNIAYTNDSKKDSELKDLLEEEYLISKNAKKINKLLSYIENDLNNKLKKEFKVEDSYISFKEYNNNILKVFIKTKDNYQELYLTKVNNKFIYLNNISYNQEICSYLLNYFNKLIYLFNGILTSDYYNSSLINIEDSRIKLMASNKGINLYLPYDSIEETSDLFEKSVLVYNVNRHFNELKKEILRTIYISTDDLNPYNQEVKTKEYKKILKR